VVTINTSEDLLRVLRENPEWKAAVRREILSEELMNLPARFDRFVASTEQFIEEQRQFNATVEGFMARTDQRFARMEGDISEMKDTHAISKTAREAPGIAREMGFQLVRSLTYDDLLEMDVAADTTDIDTPSLRSFRRADIVIEAVDEDGATHYIAMEVSYTADQRDTGRAIRNAGYLTRFTGHPAHPAVASVRNVDEIRDLINGGQVYWYELDDRTPRPEA